MIKETAGEGIVGDHKKVEASKPLSFHKSIVQAIGEVSSHEEMAYLAKLIRTTVIPKDHDEIVAAWIVRCHELKGLLFHTRKGVLIDSHGVIESVFDQLNKKKATETAKSDDSQPATC
ncbi:MAG: hypothetical protein HYT68_01805 [Candidatus Zambryskibacteria bacterium]|nr:hypothetical protein [Candidatus Zambryskibacteria bacterium]